MNGSIRDSPEFAQYAAAGSLDTAPLNYAFAIPHAEIVAGLVRGQKRAIALLEQANRWLVEKWLDEFPDAGPIESVGERLSDSSLKRIYFWITAIFDRVRIESNEVIKAPIESAYCCNDLFPAQVLARRLLRLLRHLGPFAS